MNPHSGWTLQRLRLPALAARARAGQRLQIEDEPQALPLLRAEGCEIDVLTPAHWPALPAERALDLTGEGVDDTQASEAQLILTQGLHSAAAAFLSHRLRQHCPPVFIDWPEPPFRAVPSRLYMPHLPAGVIAAWPLLEDRGVPSRLCRPDDAPPGWFEGHALALAAQLLPAEGRVLAFGDARFLSEVRRHFPRAIAD